MANLATVGDFYGQTNNGQKINVSFSYKKAAGLTGTLYVMYAVYDEAADSWSIITLGNGVALGAAAITTCGTLSATIPAGTFDPNKTYGVGTWLARSGTTTGALYIDDIVVKQDVPPSVPTCSPFTFPTNGSTISAGTVGLTWNTVDYASGYKITVGTTAGGSDITNVTANGTKLNISLLPNTTYYAKIVPTNNIGDAVGCQVLQLRLLQLSL
jgi:hypothetical protein